MLHREGELNIGLIFDNLPVLYIGRQVVDFNPRDPPEGLAGFPHGILDSIGPIFLGFTDYFNNLNNGQFAGPPR